MWTLRCFTPASIDARWVELSWGDEAYLRAKFHLDPSHRLTTIHQRFRQTDKTDRTDRQDRQRSDSIGRTVLQTVAQKRGNVNTKRCYLQFPINTFVPIINKNSPGAEIAYVNFLRDNIHVEVSAYAHWTDYLISTITIYARPNLCT